LHAWWKLIFEFLLYNSEKKIEIEHKNYANWNALNMIKHFCLPLPLQEIGEFNYFKIYSSVSETDEYNLYLSVCACHRRTYLALGLTLTSLIGSSVRPRHRRIYICGLYSSVMAGLANIWIYVHWSYIRRLVHQLTDEFTSYLSV
jgi:hypothetical protein